MELIYIGDKFYPESNSILSPIYEINGSRCDWGFVQIALLKGDYVHIRQATKEEKIFYEKKLLELKEKRLSYEK